MPKVTLNKTVKIKGKGMVLAGVEVDVTAEEKKQLEKDGHIGESKRSASPTNEKEIQALIAEVTELKAKKGGDTSKLDAEIEALKEELVTKDETIAALQAEIEALSTTDLLNADQKKTK